MDRPAHRISFQCTVQNRLYQVSHFYKCATLEISKNYLRLVRIEFTFFRTKCEMLLTGWTDYKKNINIITLAAWSR